MSLVAVNRKGYCEVLRDPCSKDEDMEELMETEIFSISTRALKSIENRPN
jgi:hypothetical protein